MTGEDRALLIIEWVGVAVGVITSCWSAWMVSQFLHDAEERSLTEWEYQSVLLLCAPLAGGMVLAFALLWHVL